MKIDELKRYIKHALRKSLGTNTSLLKHIILKSHPCTILIGTDQSQGEKTASVRGPLIKVLLHLSNVMLISNTY